MRSQHLKRPGKPEETADVEERLARMHAEMKAVPQESQYSPLPDDSKREAVFVELSLGNRTQRPFGNREVAELAEKLEEGVEIQDVGFYAGSVVIPESTTLMFYGGDAEALFRVLEPIMAREPLCAAATVTTRQTASHREVILPSKLT